MFKKYLVIISFLILITTVWNTPCYSFWSKPKVESVESYDKAHELYLAKKYSEAEKEYQGFVKNNPDSLLVEAALYYIAKCHAELNNTDNAISYYKQVVDKYKEGFWVKSAKDEIVKLKATKAGK